jgi:hypothetical protein
MDMYFVLIFLISTHTHTHTGIGRICCEAPEGRINKASVLLEGSRRDSGGFRVKLELGEVWMCVCVCV